MNDDRTPPDQAARPPATAVPGASIRAAPARPVRASASLTARRILRGDAAYVWRLFIPLACGALLLAAALYPRQPFAITVGQPGDRLFLSGVYGDERADGTSYRWTGLGGPARLSLPGWGAVTAARVEVRAQSLPERSPVTAELVAGGRTAGSFPIDGVMRWHVLDAAPRTGGAALEVELSVPTAAVPGDSRQLGVKLGALRVTPVTVSATGYARLLAGEALLPLLVTLLGLALVYRWAGPAGVIARGLTVAAMPLFAALALPWALALSGYIVAVLALAIVVARGRWLLEAAARVADALDRPRIARAVAASTIVAYGAFLTWLVLRVPWIGHADYADNAVVAANLVRGRGFSVDYVAQFYRDYSGVSHPADTWPPLQPLLIAPFFALFGVSTAAAKLPNVLIMMALLGLTYWVGARWWSPRAGLLAALFLALHTYLFNGVLYPLNDLAFTLLSFAVLVLLALPLPIRHAAPQVRGPGWRERAYWPLVGFVVALLYLSKPSGLILVGGAALWRLWRSWRWRELGAVVRGGAVAILVALLAIAPWLVRNITTFGVPFFSTEQYDAWILKYQPDEMIYRVYAGRLPLPHPRLLVGYGFDWVAQVNLAQMRRLESDVAGGRLAPLALLPLAALGIVLLTARQRGLWAPLAAAIVPYAAFVMIYWHYERRYTLFLLPWLMLAAAAAIWWLHERIAVARGARVAVLVTLVLTSFIVAPQAGAMRDDAAAARVTPSSVAIAQWVASNTPADAVIMTRNPWELSFHSGRQTVMIPYDSLEAIFEVAKQYNVTYLQLDHLNDRYTRRQALGPLYDGEERFGFQKVYAAPGWIVYRFPRTGR